MAYSKAKATGPADPQILVLIDGVIDDRVIVATTLVRFEEALAKSDMLGDDDYSAEAKGTKDKALLEEARLTITRDRLVVVKAELACLRSLDARSSDSFGMRRFIRQAKRRGCPREEGAEAP